MANKFFSDWRNPYNTDSNEDEKELTPSQKAAAYNKTKTKGSLFYDWRNADEEARLKAEETAPIVSKPSEEAVPKKSFFQKIGDSISGVKEAASNIFSSFKKEDTDYIEIGNANDLVKKTDWINSTTGRVSARDAARVDIEENNQKINILNQAKKIAENWKINKTVPNELEVQTLNEAYNLMGISPDKVKLDTLIKGTGNPITDFMLKLEGAEASIIDSEREKLEIANDMYKRIAEENKSQGAFKDFVEGLFKIPPSMKEYSAPVIGKWKEGLSKITEGTSLGIDWLEPNKLDKELATARKAVEGGEQIPIWEQRGRNLRESLSYSQEFLLANILARGNKAGAVTINTLLTGSGRVFNDFADRVSDEKFVIPTENGFELGVSKNGSRPDVAVMGAIANGIAQNTVEVLLGDAVDKVLGAGGKFFGKPLRKSMAKVVDYEKITKPLMESAVWKGISKFFGSTGVKAQAQISSFPGELAEEIVGGWFDQITRGENPTLDGEQLKETAINVAISQLAFGAAGFIGNDQKGDVTQEDLSKLSPTVRTTLEGVVADKDEITDEDITQATNELISQLEGGKIQVEQLLFSGGNGKVEEALKKYENVKVVDGDQKVVLRELVDNGDSIAQSLLVDENGNERTKIDYAKADAYIQQSFKDEFDAIQYNRTDLPKVQTEIHDLAQNKFYTPDKGLAKLYSYQRRGEKYKTEEFQQFDKKVLQPKGREAAEDLIVSRLKSSSSNVNEQQITDYGKRLGITLTLPDTLGGYKASFEVNGETFFSAKGFKNIGDALINAIQSRRARLEDLTGVDAEVSPDRSSKAPKKKKVVGKSSKLYSTIRTPKEAIAMVKGNKLTIKPMELPEINQLYRLMTGNQVEVKKKMFGALGRAYHGSMDVKLLADIFKDPVAAAKTLAHEIGHITDYIPTGSPNGRNLAKKIMFVNELVGDAFGKVQIKDREVRDELKALTQLWKPFNEKEVSEAYAKYRYSAKEMYADAVSILINDPELLQKEAPIFWKGFFDYLDQKPKAMESYMELWDLLQQSPNKIKEERDKLIRNSWARGEEKTLAAYKQRQSDEKPLQILRNAWFSINYMFKDKNEAVNSRIKMLEKNGIQIQDDPQAVLESLPYTSSKINAYLTKNYEPVKLFLESKGLSWEDLSTHLFLDRVVNERGDITKEEIWNAVDTSFLAAELREKISDTEVMSSMDLFESIKDYIVQSKGDQAEDILMTLISFMPNKKGIANPLGFTTKTAQEQIDFNKEQLGEKKFADLLEATKMFREGTKDILSKEGISDFFGRELLEEMRLSDHYATFAVTEYVQDYLPATVKGQVGTMKEIINVAAATMMKNTSIFAAIERNNAKLSVHNFMTRYFPEELEVAPRLGERGFKEPGQGSGKKLLMFMQEGKLQGYWVDEYIVDIFDNSDSAAVKSSMKILSFLNNSWFRPVFTAYNLGWFTRNVVRDFQRYYLNMPISNPMGAFFDYIKAVKPTLQFIKGQKNDIIYNMMESGSLGVTFSEIITGETDEDGTINRQFSKYGVEGIKGNEAGKNVFKKILDQLSVATSFFEALPKVAGYMRLTAKGEAPIGDIPSFIRNYVGSPNFRRKGAAYTVYNNVLLYSNAVKEGVRSDLKIATNPNTRMGFWLKFALVRALPIFIQFAAVMGVFGDDLKKLLKKIPGYDLTNYTTVPLGSTDDGRTVYLRLPHSETARILGAILWKGLDRTYKGNFTLNDLPSDLIQILSPLSDMVPSASPLATSALAHWQYLQGSNPYDFFRGREVISRGAFTAKDATMKKEYWTWQFNNLGGSIFLSLGDKGSSDRNKTPLDKLSTVPVLGSVLKSWLKASNLGESEEVWEQQDKEEREKAQINNRIKEEAKKLVKEKGSLSDEDMGAMLTKYIAESEKDPVDIRKMIKKSAVQYGAASSSAYQISVASNNSEKTSLILSKKEDFDGSEFTSFMEELVKFELVSEDYLRTLWKDDKIIDSTSFYRLQNLLDKEKNKWKKYDKK